MDSAFQLCSVKNLIILPNKESKLNFLDIVYPHYIDCVVISIDEVENYKGSYKVAFIGCYSTQYESCENIILDDILLARDKHYGNPQYTIYWTPETLAVFLSKWFGQGKLRKMNNNLQGRFQKNNIEWIRKITVGDE